MEHCATLEICLTVGLLALLTELTTRSTSLTSTFSQHLEMYMRQDSILCSWIKGCCSSFSFSQCFLECKESSQERFPPFCPSLSCNCFISAAGTCFSPIRMGAHGRVVRIFQPWGRPRSKKRLLSNSESSCTGVSDTQPPLCKAVVNY